MAEDEYLLAEDLSHALASAGASVLGPVPTLDEATALISGDTEIDAAILDVNLRGEMIFPVADALKDRGVPFAFATGYDQWALPERFAATPRVEKPFKVSKIGGVLGLLLKATPTG
ncbi:response regulator [Sphingomonas jeddahensis]|uniref:response regulator n=1 Tax=Sphingomonas jeddahensis TaxID=1915074 RepID=UPI001E42A65D|nr:response regulator [Sphingomonas jeddahensis]